MNVSLLDLTPAQQSQILYENGITRIDKFDAKEHWTPQLYIENAIGQIGEQDKWFTIMRRTTENSESLPPPTANLEICEHRRVKGVFWEKLELNHVSVVILFNQQTISLSCWFSFRLMYKI